MSLKYLKNKEKIKEYRINNLDKINEYHKEYSKVWYERNKIELRRKRHERYLRDKEKLKNKISVDILTKFIEKEEKKKERLEKKDTKENKEKDHMKNLNKIYEFYYDKIINIFKFENNNLKKKELEKNGWIIEEKKIYPYKLSLDF
jgi:hypothetical protein